MELTEYAKIVIKQLEQDIQKAKENLDNLKMTYSIGDRFYRNSNHSEKYILIGVQNSEVALVSLSSGCSRTKPVRVCASGGIRIDELKNTTQLMEITRYWDNSNQIEENLPI